MHNLLELCKSMFLFVMDVMNRVYFIKTLFGCNIFAFQCKNMVFT